MANRFTNRTGRARFNDNSILVSECQNKATVEPCPSDEPVLKYERDMVYSNCVVTGGVVYVSEESTWFPYSRIESEFDYVIDEVQSQSVESYSVKVIDDRRKI